MYCTLSCHTFVVVVILHCNKKQKNKIFFCVCVCVFGIYGKNTLKQHLGISVDFVALQELKCLQTESTNLCWEGYF